MSVVLAWAVLILIAVAFIGGLCWLAWYADGAVGVVVVLGIIAGSVLVTAAVGWAGSVLGWH